LGREEKENGEARGKVQEIKKECLGGFQMWKEAVKAQNAKGDAPMGRKTTSGE